MYNLSKCAHNDYKFFSVLQLANNISGSGQVLAKGGSVSPDIVTDPTAASSSNSPATTTVATTTTPIPSTTAATNSSGSGKVF